MEGLSRNVGRMQSHRERLQCAGECCWMKYVAHRLRVVTCYYSRVSKYKHDRKELREKTVKRQKRKLFFVISFTQRMHV